MTKAKAFNTFKQVGEKFIPAIHANVEVYEHKKTGALHLHIASENTENVFMVAFRTMPESSNGVAHILEHTALCGSERYPSRDPFFSMLRRSLQSFMNAFTSCDWTAYPFATPNKKDFNNLLGVYLDAAFFPRLDKLDFLQEGHRVDFAETGNKNSPLIFKGVVFNEMKGAMSPPERVLHQEMQTALCPNTTYAVNSGGEPADIPNLTYEEFKDFHKTHYHPSNATFMTFGDIPAAEHQEKFETLVLHRFEKLGKHFSVPNVKRYQKPLKKHIRYAFDEADTSNRTFIQLGWLLGESTNMLESLKVKLLMHILLGDSSAPLLSVLESTDLGTAPHYGLDPDNKEMMWMVGLQGSEAKNEEAVEKLILETLEKVAKDGIPQKRLNALLDQMEISVRDLESGYPIGLSMMLNCMNQAIHGGDLLKALDVEPVLKQLREEASKAGFVQNLVQDMLLNNPHRVTVVAEPDTALSAQKAEAEAKRLADMKANMTDADLDNVIATAKALDDRQSQTDDTSSLPTVTMADIPQHITYPQGLVKTEQGVEATTFKAGTNGLVSQSMVFQMPQLTERQIQLLPYYTSLVTEVAVGQRNYMEVGEWQTSICSAFYAQNSIRNALGHTDKVNAVVTFKAKGLERHSQEMVDMMVETIQNVSFHEHARLKDIVGQMKLAKERGILGNGHVLAAAAAGQNMGIAGNISFKTGGLAGVQFVKQLHKDMDDKQKLAAIAEELTEIHNLVKVAPKQVMCIAEDEKANAVSTALAAGAGQISAGELFEGFAPQEVSGNVAQAWVTNTQVNFCSKAYKTVTSNHADAPALQVLAGYLRNNFLHTAIREKGGAYGGGARYSGDDGNFAFYSYRDPRITGTLADYDKAIEWVLSHQHDENNVKEAIFGVISAIDAPNTPMADASINFMQRLHGRSDDVRMDYRSRILQVTAADLVRVVQTYLKPENANTAIITSASALKNEGQGLQLDVIQL